MLNGKLKPISGGGIPGYNKLLNEIVAAVNWLQGIRTVNGQPIADSATGPVIDLSPVTGATPAATADGTGAGALTPDGETAGWYEVSILSADRTTISSLWVWAGQPRNPVPCS